MADAAGSRRAALKGALWWALAAAALALLGVRYFAFQVVALPDDGMRPSLARGDRLWVERVSNDYAPGDVVVFAREEAFFVRRVVARGGQRVAVRDGLVYLEGAAPEMKSLGLAGVCDVWLESVGSSSREICRAASGGAQVGEVEVPAGSYLVLCDDRAACPGDSAALGLIRKGAIRGRATHLLAREGEPGFPGQWEEL